MSHPIAKVDPTISTEVGVNVPVSQLKAAALVAAKTREMRYYLRNVFIEASCVETRTVATDGNMLVAMRHTGIDPDHAINWLPPREQFPHDFSLLVPTGVIDSIKVHSRNDRPHASICYVDDDTWELTVRDVMGRGAVLSVQRFTTPEGVFPDYRRVIPSVALGSKRADEPAQFSLALAANIQKAAAVYTGKREPRLLMEHFDGDVVRMLVEGNDDAFVAVLMGYMKSVQASTGAWFKDAI